MYTTLKHLSIFTNRREGKKPQNPTTLTAGSTTQSNTLFEREKRKKNPRKTHQS